MGERELADAVKDLSETARKHSLKLVWPGLYYVMLKAPFVAWPALPDGGSTF